MIILRPVYRGIADHFPIRISEWIMMLPTFGMWAGLQAQPHMFAISPSFASIARWGDEGTWAVVVLACGVTRLAALTINGTFAQFRFSPHMRFAASLIGILFWSQFTLGFVDAAVSSGGSLSPIVAYSTFVVMELANLFRSSVDIGSDYKSISRAKHAGKS